MVDSHPFLWRHVQVRASFALTHLAELMYVLNGCLCYAVFAAGSEPPRAPRGLVSTLSPSFFIETSVSDQVRRKSKRRMLGVNSQCPRSPQTAQAMEKYLRRSAEDGNREVCPPELISFHRFRLLDSTSSTPSSPPLNLIC